MDRDRCRDILKDHFVLFSVEGTAEAAIINSLIENDALIVPYDHLVSDYTDATRYYTRTRKAKDIVDRYFNVNYRSATANGLAIARIVDTSSGKFVLPKSLKDEAEVLSFYTKPEIEMLVIHREGAFREWERASRKDRSLRPNVFCKSTLGIKDVKEDRFLSDYWSDCGKLIHAIKVYSETAHRDRDELMLVDLLK